MTALTFVILTMDIKIITKNEAKGMIKDLGFYGRYKYKLIYKALNCIGDKKC